MLYPVCVHQDGDGALGATMPDFPGCFSGATDWSSLPDNVREAVKLYCGDDRGKVPKPSCPEDLRGRPEYAGGTWAFIDVDSPATPERAVKDALRALDALHDAPHGVRDALNGIGSSDGRGLCWCGCGQAVDSYFKPGHDAKAKKLLCKLHYGGCPSNLPEHVHGAEKSAIANLLALHGYGPHNSLRLAFHISLLEELL